MNEKQSKKYPYKELGIWLKNLRQKKQETLAEVSGAVEIDPDVLSEIESGATRPSEDILMLFISYFSVREEEAVRVWELAGYNNTRENISNVEQNIQQVFVLPMDARVIYTDLAHVTSNKYGLTINFMQAEGLGGQPLAVSRIGMSKEHARRLINVLERSLEEPAQKLLPEPKKDSDAA